MSLMNPRTEKLVRRLTIVTTVTASYFLLTADYGPQPNALDPFYLICASKAIHNDKNSVKKHKSNTSLCPPEIVSGNKNMAQYLICYCVGFTVTTPKNHEPLDNVLSRSFFDGLEAIALQLESDEKKAKSNAIEWLSAICRDT
ncbi:hypothetical protein V8G54_009218 [Vigna mungo]|uniref:Uncharacterized protein n=1 Tax=Vigna mungo TaxID=3915 RepID=A0AAQ3NWB8_VIGMU